jgi:uncharacterized Zn-binding protein involved in type VI secretion
MKNEMGQPAATQGSLVVGVDTHIVMVPSPGGPIPTPLPHPFSGTIDGGTVQTVKIMGKPAAVVDSQATNSPSHIATPPGTSFQAPPQNKSTIKVGSATVKIGGKQAARNGDLSVDCDDLTPTAPKGQVIAAGTVMIG